MPEVKRSQPIWAISDGRAGNARQAMALAHAVAGLRSMPVQEQRLAPPAPWRWLAPRWCPGSHYALGSAFAGTAPALAIGCGRQAALATRLLRGRGSFGVQILDPRLSARHWDLLVVPEHDQVRGENVLTLLGSLNPVDEVWLAAGRKDFPELGTLPGPRLVLLLGGPTAQVPWHSEQLAPLCAQLGEWLTSTGGSLLVSGSRRTPKQARPILRQALRGLPSSLLWLDEDDGPNPLPGMLGWADAIVASADSVNQLSEAAATRVPVMAAFADQAQGRVGRFVAQLREHGRLLPDLAALSLEQKLEPLRETQRIAQQVVQRAGL